VLQTLTLIQRQAHDPEAIARLARRQEHELRDWLYGRERPAQATLEGEIRDIARDVEATHGVAIDLVQVGDAPMENGLRSLTEAAREALVNAAKHSGASAISLFVEVDGDATVVYVRDRGCGFDPTTVADDRVGIRESIHGRLSRIGGTAEVTSLPGDGTEIELRLPRHRSASEGAT
jgi:signal transduction histidine kinase